MAQSKHLFMTTLSSICMQQLACDSSLLRELENFVYLL